MDNSPAARRIVGVDPGLRITGYAVIESAASGPVLCEAGVVRSRVRETQEDRIAEIFHGVQEVIGAFHPTVMALEQLFSKQSLPRTALVMAHVRGVICLAAAQSGIPVIHYTATRIKKLLTGNGHAPKGQMQRAIQAELRLNQLPEPPDVADAMALALCHHYAELPADDTPRPLSRTGNGRGGRRRLATNSPFLSG